MINSIQCSKHKFISQGEVYFNNRFKIFESYTEFQSSYRKLEEEAFCLILDSKTNLPEKLYIEDCFLVECLHFDDDNFNISLIKRKNETINLSIPAEKKKFNMDDNLSISLICTENKLYSDFLIETIDFHTRELKDFIDIEFSVAFFGNTPPKELLNKKIINLEVKPLSQFSMSFARNLSLQNCNYKNILMTDLDMSFSKENLEIIFDKVGNIPNQGVINLKNNYKMGNGLYFGLKDKLLQNKYNEDFKEFWFEDTEYLMNFSRIGMIPSVYFVDFIQKDHSREHTIQKRQHYDHNKNLFINILKHGR